MPTKKKTLMFLAGFCTSLGSFVVLCTVLGRQNWVSSTIPISDIFSNGTVVIVYGLFRGTSTQRLDLGLEESDKYFEVLGTLRSSSQKTLQALVILLLALSLFTSLLSAGVTLYNSISNPYQTFLGPTGVYTWNGLNASFVLLALLLFVGNTQANRLSETLSQTINQMLVHKEATHSYGYAFWLLLLVILLNILTVVIIVFYQKARYQRKQEQRKPMEYAPRDGILF
ncbi:clarin-3 [Echinops telfairi]|uniref:Clarin-3 n=1 Tax=Echinops telfairi TaxID=9371 RepID=A0ABM0IIP9_ECHTE|nr:clarin-3 [Echinops telfairi]